MPKWLTKLANSIKTAPKTPTIVGLGYWFFINIVYTDGYMAGKVSNELFAFFKIASLIATIAFTNFIAAQFRRAKKDKLHQKFLKRSLLYFVILTVLLLLVWPGIYAHDDIFVLSKATRLSMDPWQHFISSLHMIISIMLLPIASAPVIFQCIFASLIVGYISTYAPTIFGKDKKKQKKISIALFAVFLLPPVVLHVLCGYRMSIYQYFEIFILVYLYIHYRKSEKISTTKMLGLLFLSILLCSWRTEGIYYIIGLPILFFIMRKPLFTTKQIISYSLIIIVSTLGIFKINTHLIGSNRYSLGALMVPISGIIDGAIETNDTETLDTYNKAFDIKCIEKNSISKMPERIFWDCSRDTDDETISLVTKTTIQQTPKYFGSIVEKYSDIVCDAFLGIKCGAYNTGQTGATFIADFTNFYFSENAKNSAIAFENFVPMPLNEPINYSVRKFFINFLSGRIPSTDFDNAYLYKKYDAPSYAIPVYYQLFYSLIVPIIAFIAAFVLAIRRRNHIIIWMLILIAGRVAIVAATGMASYLMYFMPFYISALVLFITILADKKRTGHEKVAKKARK